MMSKMDGVEKLGLFVRPGFFEDVFCARLCQAISSADLTAAEVYDGKALAVDHTVRRTGQTLLEGSLRREAQRRLEALAPALSAHFETPLTKTEGVSFLRYRPGDFFKPHRDRSAEHTVRQISVIVFLNDDYSGGELQMYGLLPDAPQVGFPVAASTGLLVAFRSTTLHEVASVREGIRMTAVDWLS